MLTLTWIGLDDIDEEDTFRWRSSGQQLTWNNWKSDEPNDPVGGEDCVLADIQNDFVWMDAPCMFNIPTAICEIPL